MLDLKLIRTQPEKVLQSLQKRGYDSKILDELLKEDNHWRELIKITDELKQERNKASEEIGQLKKTNQNADTLQESVRKINEKIKTLEVELKNSEEKLQQLVLFLPNMIHSTTPVGKDSSENPVVKVNNDFAPILEAPHPHWEIAESLELIDFTRSAKLSGSMFALYTGLGSKLQRALIQFMLDFHIEKHQYIEIYPPYLVRPEIMMGTGQLPKFKDDMYHCETDDLYLIPTAEVPVTNMHRDEILKLEDLPKNYAAYSACFRREAGAAGADTRGLQRLHQFDKVELVKMTLPETSYDEHEKLLLDVEDVMKALEIRYRVITLCSGDIGFSAAKCYDVEAWSPANKKWAEVSSCSNFEDFQARRANIRFRRTPKDKPEFVHTLNASGMALPRIVIAILENYQESDETVVIPKVLRPYMRGLEKISKGKP